MPQVSRFTIARTRRFEAALHTIGRRAARRRSPMIAVIAVSIAVGACDRPALTPQAYIYADLVGRTPEAEGRAAIRGLGAGRSEVSVELPKGSGKDWLASIRSGSCSQPGEVEYLVGAIEGGDLQNTLAVDPGSLVGRIVVITRLSDDKIASCGQIGP